MASLEEKEAPSVSSLLTPSDWVRLNIGGTGFATPRANLLLIPFFEALLSGRFALDYSVDRDPTWFHTILNYCRSRDRAYFDRITDTYARFQLSQELQFYGLEGLVKKPLQCVDGVSAGLAVNYVDNTITNVVTNRPGAIRQVVRGEQDASGFTIRYRVHYCMTYDYNFQLGIMVQDSKGDTNYRLCSCRGGIMSSVFNKIDIMAEEPTFILPPPIQSGSVLSLKYAHVGTLTLQINDWVYTGACTLQGDLYGCLMIPYRTSVEILTD